MTEEQLRKEYEEKLANLRKTQNNCNHEWEEVKYDPEIKKEPASYEYEGAGVDKWPVVTSWKEVKIPRWSRKCKKCDKIEYTYDQKPTKYEPDFK